MNAPGKIVLYFIAVFVLGALLTPPLYWAVEKARPAAEENGWLRYEVLKNGERKAEGWAAFLDSDLGKVSNRALLIVAVVLLIPLFRGLGIRSTGELGLSPNPHRWRDFFAGLFISVGVMALLAGVLLRLGVYEMKDPVPWSRLASVLIIMAVVPPLEEWFFRGAILGSLRKTMNAWAALFVVTAIFATLHVLRLDDDAAMPEHVHWLSGFALIPPRFHAFTEPFLLLGSVLTYFCFGWVCGWSVLRTRGLAMAIGFHAGMIFGKFGFNKVASRPKKMRDLLPWIGEDMVVGVVGVGVVCLVGLLLWIYLRYVDARSRSKSSP